MKIFLEILKQFSFVGDCVIKRSGGKGKYRFTEYLILIIQVYLVTSISQVLFEVLGLIFFSIIPYIIGFILLVDIFNSFVFSKCVDTSGCWLMETSYTWENWRTYNLKHCNKNDTDDDSNLNNLWNKINPDTKIVEEQSLEAVIYNFCSSPEDNIDYSIIIVCFWKRTKSTAFKFHLYRNHFWINFKLDSGFITCQFFSSLF